MVAEIKKFQATHLNLGFNGERLPFPVTFAKGNPATPRDLSIGPLFASFWHTSGRLSFCLLLVSISASAQPMMNIHVALVQGAVGKLHLSASICAVDHHLTFTTIAANPCQVSDISAKLPIPTHSFLFSPHYSRDLFQLMQIPIVKRSCCQCRTYQVG